MKRSKIKIRRKKEVPFGTVTLHVPDAFQTTIMVHNNGGPRRIQASCAIFYISFRYSSSNYQISHNFVFLLSFFSNFYNDDNNNNNGNDNRVLQLMVKYMTKIIERDKKIANEDEGAGGFADAPLPNIIPKKSPSSPLEDPRPVLLVPVLIPPPLNPGSATLLSLPIF
ncbi:hypothetical protein PanWU01x14_292430 [Parasponia andersonii]|uniref:Uncharacterized protein n=1 Tax=Parasponia andersonii TaxID=3476 RepID=A0A2P5AX48_PARAD|nr:hypothetical protein PanWU01x14_292430 [Parasponia andersonii]